MANYSFNCEVANSADIFLDSQGLVNCTGGVLTVIPAQQSISDLTVEDKDALSSYVFMILLIALMAGKSTQLMIRAIALGSGTRA